MEAFVMLPGEKLLVNDPHAAWKKGGTMNVQGQLKLTDRRLVFVKNAAEFAGPLKWLFKSMRPRVELEFPLGSIKFFSASAFGNSKRLTIDNGIERLREFETTKTEIFEFELKRLAARA
jgi:hypothetical protein